MSSQLEAASAMICEAGELLRGYYESGVEVQSKGDIDLVTEADHAVEKFILSWIEEQYPSHSILAEESGQKDLDSEFRWIVDPLDGTVNFAHGLGHFSILVALQKRVDESFETQLALTLDPMRNELFTAQKGAGTTLNGQPIAVSKTTELRQALLCTGFGYDRLTNESDNHREFCRLNLLTRGVRRYGSAGLDLAYVACGRYDGFWEWDLNPWDIAGGILLVEEAGGLVTSVDGSRAELEVGSILCANPGFHGTIKKALDSAKEVPINSRQGMGAFLPEEAMAELVKSGLGEA